uniref:AAA+ ATPase domain-containing protein n=1 Tax=Neospora caninum (strain Liverpool) TaxID=572307 RepID=A0A0F7UF79_NEOCL|nr:TPA: hypothetical protein BN1204_027365 [Neospora caninum Liverpool]
MDAEAAVGSSSLASLLQNGGAFQDASSPFFLTVAADPQNPWSSLWRVKEEVLKAFSAAPLASRSPFRSHVSPGSASLSLNGAADACASHGSERSKREGDAPARESPSRATDHHRPEVYVQEVWSSDLWDRQRRGSSWADLLRESLSAFLASASKTKILLLMHPDAWFLPPTSLPAPLPCSSSPAVHASARDTGADDAAGGDTGSRLAAQLTGALRDQLEDSDAENRDGVDSDEDAPRTPRTPSLANGRKCQGRNRRQDAQLRDAIEVELDALFRWLQEALRLQVEEEESNRDGQHDLLAHAINFLASSDSRKCSNRPSWFPTLPAGSAAGLSSSPGSAPPSRAFVIALLRLPLRPGSVFQRAFSLHFPFWRISSGSCRRSGASRVPARRGRGSTLRQGVARDLELSISSPKRENADSGGTETPKGMPVNAEDEEEKEGEEDEEWEEDKEGEEDENDEDKMEVYREAALGALAALADAPILECEENWDEPLRWVLQGGVLQGGDRPCAVAGDPTGLVGEAGNRESRARWEEGETPHLEERRLGKGGLSPVGRSGEAEGCRPRVYTSTVHAPLDPFQWIPEGEEGDCFLDDRERNILSLWKKQAGLGRTYSRHQKRHLRGGDGSHLRSLPSPASPWHSRHSASSSTFSSTSSSSSSSSSPFSSSSCPAALSSSVPSSSSSSGSFSASSSPSAFSASATPHADQAASCPSRSYPFSLSRLPPPLFASSPPHSRSPRSLCAARQAVWAALGCAGTRKRGDGGRLGDSASPRLSTRTRQPDSSNFPETRYAGEQSEIHDEEREDRDRDDKDREDKDREDKGREDAFSASSECGHLALFEQVLRRRGLPAIQFLPPRNVQLLLRVPLSPPRRQQSAQHNTRQNEEARSREAGRSAPHADRASREARAIQETNACGRLQESPPARIPRGSLVSEKAPRAILICGPTGSGKTTLLHALGELFGGGFAGESEDESEEINGERGSERALERKNGNRPSRRGGGSAGVIHTHVGELLQAVVGGSQRALLKIFVDAAGTSPHAAVCIEGLDAALGLRGKLWEDEVQKATRRANRNDENAASETGSQREGKDASEVDGRGRGRRESAKRSETERDTESDAIGAEETRDGECENHKEEGKVKTELSVDSGETARSAVACEDERRCTDAHAPTPHASLAVGASAQMSENGAADVFASSSEESDSNFSCETLPRDDSSELSSDFGDGGSSEDDSPAHEVQRNLAQFFETLVEVYVHHVGVPLLCTISIHPESVPPEILRCFHQIIVLRPIHYCLADATVS